MQLILRLILLCFPLLTTAFATSVSPADIGQSWVKVEIGIIGAASEDILKSALAKVEEGQHKGLVLVLDTPGGALDSTRKMVKDILGSQFPIVVWVGPSGSRAASAGAFITLAGHVAAMAPGSNIGAAHPVQADGDDVQGEHMAKKIENDTAAFIESIAKERGRNTEMALSFVITSASITAEEAQKNNIVDFIAHDLDELMNLADGKEVALANGTQIKLATRDAKFVPYERSIKQEFLEIISNPNLFYLLFIAGLIGLGFELTHPGGLFPGVAGGICLVLALIATSVLPVSFGAMVLLLIGVAFMIAEAFLPSFGVLGIGGFVAFLFGSFLLVDPSNEQGLRISLWTILPGATAVGIGAAVIGYLILRAERSKPKAGPETMKGDTASVITAFVDGHGQVRLQGEIWSATSKDDLKLNDQVSVVGVDGLNLFVEKSGDS